MSKIAVIGGGIGGLCAAMRLAAEGHNVHLFERNSQVGGKLWPALVGAYQFSYGPSTLTMPDVFRELLQDVGLSKDLIPYQRLTVNHRNVFADGRQFDAVTDIDRMTDQLRAFDEKDARHWADYIRDVNRMAQVSKREFFARTFTKPSEFLSMRLLSAFATVHPFTPMNQFHRKHFQSREVLMSLDRYATYVGSDPRQTPATLAMIGGIEFCNGVYTLSEGTSHLVQILEEAALSLGVDIHCDAEVTAIFHKDKKIIGVEVNQERFSFDFVVFNGDRSLLPYLLRELSQWSPHPRTSSDKEEVAQADKRNLSLSGFVLLLGVKKQYPTLLHHTVFFPDEYEKEFDSIFGERSLPKDPTIYICNTSVTNALHAPEGGSNLFVLVNVPSVLRSDEEWHTYRDYILHLLETRCGLRDLRNHLDVSVMVTPNHLHTRTSTPYGAIYGTASHGVSAFRRPPLRDRRWSNLFFVGGTTHPGGGTPMVALSAKLVSQLISKG